MHRTTVDVPKLFALWHDKSLTRTEVARAVGLTDKQLCSVAARHALGRRGPTPRNESFVEGEPLDDESESLAFSPWVAARIKELRLGMPT